ncbi:MULTISPECIES: ankyrin repeat domain-containing protein [unclassified Agrococcus]|uniref:ankyrin repeat domain-containing protein n=1 Tax=unclassified Agrococcus TaxID=2615065 RepID=UPI003609E305
MTGRRLLSEAARGDLACVTAMLDAGADVEHRHSWKGTTPLMEAVIGGHLEVASALIDRGADLEAACTARGRTALGYAVGGRAIEMARLLLRRGADVDHVPEDSFLERTPLHEAALIGDVEMVRVLMAAGADPGRVDRRGDNALSLARPRPSLTVDRFDRPSVEPPLRASTVAEVEVVETLIAAGATDPVLAPFPPSMPWPELHWDPTRLREASTLPPGAQPAQVVTSYIQALHAWEVEVLRTVEPNGSVADLRAALAVAHLLSALHLTDRPRASQRGGFSRPPLLTPKHALLEVTMPSSTRCELLVRHPHPMAVVHEDEWSFVCLRRAGEWRIDSARTRMHGTLRWERAIL